MKVALVGPPNSGKTTIYNWLTGSKFRAVNYPGATVDYFLGKTHERYKDSFIVIDTPGIYGFTGDAPDEQVTKALLFEGELSKEIQGVIVTIDVTQMERQLHLVKFLQRSGYKCIVALTMGDLVEDDGLEVKVEALASGLNCAVVKVDGRLGGGVHELVAQARIAFGDLKNDQAKSIKLLDSNEFQSQQKSLQTMSAKVLNSESSRKLTAIKRTRKFDQFLLHPVLGLILFLMVMMTLFSSIFWVAAPFMDFVDGFFGSLGEWILEIGQGQLWSDFIANGIIASFGAVLVFVPQIFILFFGISFLEDSGYLARAATIVDKPLSKIGLSGRSFVPLLSGYACAVPAMMAARNIGSKRERWLTLFILPFMTCSARLPVYALLLLFIFQNDSAFLAGLTLTGLYLGSFVIAAIASSIADRFLPQVKTDHFLLELPIYRKPNIRVLIKTAMYRTMSYVKRAGPIIFYLALVIWMSSTFPNYELENDGEKLRTSYIGQLGAIVEPVFEPMGVDWKVGVGLVSAFAAREVFVSSLAIVFSITDTDEEGLTKSLIAKMKTATNLKGEKIFTLASVIGLILFFMIALQCISTTAIAQKETGSWKFAISQVVLFNVVAYIVAVSVVQTLRFFGIS